MTTISVTAEVELSDAIGEADLDDVIGELLEVYDVSALREALSEDEDGSEDFEDVINSINADPKKLNGFCEALHELELKPLLKINAAIAAVLEKVED